MIALGYEESLLRRVGQQENNLAAGADRKGKSYRRIIVLEAAVCRAGPPGHGLAPRATWS
jgi:hypothetical protein